jgi:hypothetical protein
MPAILKTGDSAMTRAMQNPWQQLPRRKPFVLGEDREQIESFNLHARGQHQIQLGIFPEPFLGRPKAPVVLLNLNPGYNAKADPIHHKKPLFARRSRENLLHAEVDYPFYLIGPGLVHLRERTAWWDKKMRCLLEDKRLGHSAESRSKMVANGVLCVEYFPYHSRKFNHQKLRVPSQEYSFLLVREAIRREAVILLMRGKKFWCREIDELNSYPGLYISNSPQNPAISPANFCEGYSIAIDAIRRDCRRFR